MGDSVLVAGLVAFGIVVLRVLAMLIHTRDDAD